MRISFRNNHVMCTYFFLIQLKKEYESLTPRHRRNAYLEPGLIYRKGKKGRKLWEWNLIREFLLVCFMSHSLGWAKKKVFFLLRPKDSCNEISCAFKIGLEREKSFFCVPGRRYQGEGKEIVFSPTPQYHVLSHSSGQGRNTHLISYHLIWGKNWFHSLISCPDIYKPFLFSPQIGISRHV